MSYSKPLLAVVAATLLAASPVASDGLKLGNLLSVDVDLSNGVGVGVDLLPGNGSNNGGSGVNLDVGLGGDALASVDVGTNVIPGVGLGVDVLPSNSGGGGGTNPGNPVQPGTPGGPDAPGVVPVSANPSSGALQGLDMPVTQLVGLPVYSRDNYLLGWVSQFDGTNGDYVTLTIRLNSELGFRHAATHLNITPGWLSARQVVVPMTMGAFASQVNAA